MMADFSHLWALVKKSAKTNVRSWKRLAPEISLPVLTMIALWAVVNKGDSGQKPDVSRITTRFDSPEEFALEEKSGMRLRSTESLKWRCNSNNCTDPRWYVNRLCERKACWPYEMDINPNSFGPYIALEIFDGLRLRANFTASELGVVDPAFQCASEEYERQRGLPYPGENFHHFVGTVLKNNAKKANFTGRVLHSYFKYPEYETSSESILFDKADVVTRYIVTIILVLLPILPCLSLATALGDEKKSEIKKYLLTMGISRETYLLSHVIATFIKAFPFAIIASCIIFFPNWGFVWMFSLTYILYTISCLALGILVTIFVHNPKLISDCLLVVVPCFLLMAVASFAVKRTDVVLAILSCLNPGYALLHSLDALRECSLKGGHILWLSDFPYVLPFGLTLILQIVDTVFLMALAIGLDYLAASSFSPLQWISRYRRVNTDEEEKEFETFHEEVETNKKVAIEIADVYKTYSNGERALRGATLNIYENENTVVLGQNGAGKSTMFDMITRAALPSSGSITVNWPNRTDEEGKDIVFRRIGLCPQYSPIFPKLTVVEHLQFFAELGGEEDWERKAKDYMDLLKLDEFEHQYAESLSGGNRRKLCIANALIGDSDIILMDEPSAGVDTETRAVIKRFLNEKRGKRTLVITTHYTDEAEDLGDRICIMAKGKVACSGTSSFLCEKLASGYELNCVVATKTMLEATADRTLRLAQDFVPATIKSCHGEEFTLFLPNGDSARLNAFIREFYNAQERIGISNSGMKSAPLEQSFLKVAMETGGAMNAEKVNAAMKQVIEQDGIRMTGHKRTLYMLLALLAKRLIFEWRNKFYQLVWALTVFFFFWIAHTTSQFAQPTTEHNLLVLHECARLGVVNDTELAEKFRSMATDRGECMVVEDISDAKEWHRVDHFRRPPILGAIQKSGEDYIMMMAPNRRIYEPYLATMLYKTVTNGTYDIALSYMQKPNVVINKESMQKIFLFMNIFIQLVAMSRLIRSYVIEDESGYAHLQLLTGTPKRLYWIGHFIIDFLIYAIFYVYLYFVARHFDIYPESLINLLDLNIMACIITVVKMGVMHRMYTSKNKATASTSLMLILSIGAFLPLYIYLQGANPKFCLEKSFPLFLDPFVAILAFQLKIEADSPPLYSILLAQFVIVCVVFYCFEWRMWRIKCRSKKSPEKLRKAVRKAAEKAASKATKRTGNEVEMQLLGNPRPQPAEDVSVDAAPQGGARNAVLQANNLFKQYGTKLVVNGVNIVVDQNECVGLLGHNGAGKSTTFKMITGQVFSSSGDATVSGVDIEDPALIGYCPQEDALINQLTGREHLTILAALHGFENFFLVARLLLACVGMENDCDKIFKELSGGQKRKLSVCASILAMSKLIVLDEPTTGIDPMVRNDIWSLLRAIRDFTNTAILITSHSMAEVEALCTRVAVMRNGVIITHGSPQTLISNHGDYFKMEFRVPCANPDEKETQIREIVSELLPTASFSSRILSRYVFKIPRNPQDPKDYATAFDAAHAIAQEIQAAGFLLVQSNLEDLFLSLADEASQE